MRPRKRRKLTVGQSITYVLLILTLLASAFPIYWTFVVASSTNEAIADVPPRLVPGGHLMENVRRVFDNDAANFAKALVNTAIVSTTVAVSVLVLSSLAGFAFAKLRFRGRNVLLLLVVASLSVPTQLGVIPLYILMGKLHWNGHLQAVIVPFLVSAFGVFFMTQYLRQALPMELIDAARVDGASTFRTYRSIVLPIARPATAVLGLLTFVASWNDFFWPLVVLNAENPTVQVAISSLSSGIEVDYALTLTGAVVGTFPILLVFVLFGRQIIGGIMHGAVKG